MNSGMEKEIFEIYVEDIIPNRFQPRLSFDEKSLQDLSNSIKEHGIIQPLVLRKIGDKYEIIAGERRYKAAIMAGLQKVPAVLMTLDDNQSAEIAIVENTQRKDLTALEEAKSYKKLLDRKYLTQDQLASRMGKSQSFISNKMRLLNLDEEVQDALLQEKISERHARSLLSLSNPIQQKETLAKIIENKLTVKQTDELIKSMGVSVPVGSDITLTETPVEVIQESVPVAPAPLIQEESVVSNPPIMTEPTKPSTLETLTSNLESFPTDSVIKEKELAEDINPIKEQPDLNNLLNIGGTQPEVLEPIKETPPVVETMSTNKFINPIDMETEETDMTMGDIAVTQPEPLNPAITPLEPETINTSVNNYMPVQEEIIEEPAQPPLSTNTNDIIQEYRSSQQSNIVPNQNIDPNNLNSAITVIREIGKTLEKNGFILDIEEFDFEHLYQMIIKIQKK